MIIYDQSPLGFSLLFRMSGSAVYRAMIPGLVSAGLVVLIRDWWFDREREEQLSNAYAISVLLSGVSFLLAFRLQQAYARYWEAASAVHQMMRWMDAAIHTAVYHMQCDHFKHIKPPSYFDYPDLNHLHLTRDRERLNPDDMNLGDGKSRLRARSCSKSIESVRITKTAIPEIYRTASESRSQESTVLSGRTSVFSESSSRLPFLFQGLPRLDGNWGAFYEGGKATFFNARHPDLRDPAGFASAVGGCDPPVFLQELAHLSSLLTGVALATLRNDIEGAGSPLDVYIPGAPWPDVDPFMASRALKHGGWRDCIHFFTGYGRTVDQLMYHNSARPMPILGGVSDAEIRFLQMARGPWAKTQLCWYWISEFITRESISGSTGAVAPPLMSSVLQCLGEGMTFYNHARKITCIPFPFPHAQLSVVYLLLVVPTVAFLMNEYIVELWLSCLLTFFTVTVFTGMHEVARELENPFRDVPNELPLVTFQAQFNEGLLTMFSGFHPDGYWGDEAAQVREMDVLRRSARKVGTKARESASSPVSAATSLMTSDDASVLNDVHTHSNGDSQLPSSILVHSTVQIQPITLNEQEEELERLGEETRKDR